jgi:protein TonB
MTLSILAALMVVLSSQTAPADAPQAEAVQTMQWSVQPRPTPNDFPPEAMRRRASGWVDVRCTATTAGVPASCSVVEETPATLGFGQAGIRVVRRGRLNPATLGPSDEDRTFTVRVPFNAPPR